MRAAKMTPVAVECYSGYKADESPRRVRLGDAWIEVEEVLERWQQAESGGDERSDWFKVRDAAGTEYLVKHDLGSDRWFAAMG